MSKDLIEYEELFYDMRDDALRECANEFASELSKFNAGLTEIFSSSISERIEILRENNTCPRYDDEIPVEDIERIFELCKGRFSQVIGSAVDEALSATEVAFQEQIENNLSEELRKIIDNELYGFMDALVGYSNLNSR